MTFTSLLPAVIVRRRPIPLVIIAKSSQFLQLPVPDFPSTQQCLYPHCRSYSHTTRTSAASNDSFPGSNSMTNENSNNNNPGLESVIGQGLASLTQTAKDVQIKTKKVKSIASPTTTTKSGQQQQLASHKQLAESQRLLDVMTECLDAICDKNPNHPLVTMGGEPIAILDVQVNTNAKQAKVYWSLPYGILMDDRLNRTTYQTLLTRMETKLQEGGASLIQKMVHTRLRFYYPPKLKFIPAPPKMVVEAVGDFTLEEQE